MIETDKPYIAGHPAEEHKYVALMKVSKEGVPTWGKVRGKWALSNHSCDPTCQLDNHHRMITCRAVKKGEELTTAYNAFIPHFSWPESWNFECLCQSPKCRKMITGYRTDILDPLCYAALESEAGYEDLIAAWSEFFKTATWQNMIAGCQPICNGNGVVYETLNFVGRPHESCAIVDMRSITVSEPHYHAEAEFYFILQGSCAVVIGGQAFFCATGSVISIPPRVAHFTVPDAECVMAVINTPPFNPNHYVAVTESDLAVGFDYEQFSDLKASITSQVVLEKSPFSIEVWNNFFKGKTWQQVTAGYESTSCRNGVCYKLANPLDRINEDCTVLDMGAIGVAEPHYHVETVIYFFLQGGGVVVVGEQEYQCKKGDHLVIPSNVSHFVFPDADCVIAIISTPPSNVDHYKPLTKTDLSVGFDYEQFCTLAKRVK